MVAMRTASILGVIEIEIWFLSATALVAVATAVVEVVATAVVVVLSARSIIGNNNIGGGGGARNSGSGGYGWLAQRSLARPHS